MSSLVIRKAAVIGAGVMGSGIAAHLTNAGIPTLLLDIVPEAAKKSKNPKERSAIAIGAIQKQIKSKLCGFYNKSFAQMVQTGNLEDDFQKLADVDWIIEVVPENVKIKQDLFERIDAICEKVKVISSNTSGIPLKLLTKGRSENFCKKFTVTHFFNPPRFMHLVEMVPGPQTDPELYKSVKNVIERRLGKGVVDCFDTPNFIANRIGCFDLLSAMRAMDKHGLTIEEVDTIAGPPCGRPKSGVFRLLDMVGIDTIGHVIGNMYEMLPKDEFREQLKVPDYVTAMVKKNLLGSKNGQGFYKKDKSDIKVLNLSNLEYGDKNRPDFPELKDLKKISCPMKRMKALCNTDSKAGKFARDYLSYSCLYAAYKVPEIASSIVDVDRAMKWGYNHEVGPFTIWDALGVKETAEYLESQGEKMPEMVKDVLSKGDGCFYKWENGKSSAWSPQEKKYVEVPARPGTFNLLAKRDKCKIAGGNDSVTLLALENDILFVELHGKKNAFSIRVVDCVTKAIANAEGKFRAAVIGTQIDTFSVGADLTEMIGAAQSGNMKIFESAISNFQKMSMTIRHSALPVVSALTGYTFGGGCEVAMHSDARQAAPETWMGLVEAGVGILPAGGGCKEMARIASENAGPKGELFDDLFEFFQTIAMAKVTMSAYEMKNLGFGHGGDGISKNKETLLSDAIKRADMLASQGYSPPCRNEPIRVGGLPVLTEIRARLNIMLQSGFVSQHDAVIAERIAYVMCGGEIDGNSIVTADYLLGLEKAGFFQLLQMPKTQERIKYTLENGKPLRN
ncbi:MAG: 3-hydroxyacyl-CoA dehydrogenase/enoyl-CoA hydratase family protein [Lentisphaeraceae bacterium]|nr:3-hydroxyacyl-CoA dehydrogenase/enoyl-CoA hydratase family protein [Lentisphaeraceae bacterium]